MDSKKNTTSPYPAEFRERGVQMVIDHLDSYARWDGCRPPLTASQCAKVVVFKATQAGRTAR